MGKKWYLKEQDDHVSLYSGDSLLKAPSRPDHQSLGHATDITLPTETEQKSSDGVTVSICICGC